MFPIPRGTRSGKRFLLQMPFGRRMLLSVLAAGFPAVALCLILLWTNSYSFSHKLEGTLFVLITWVGLSISARGKFIYSIRVLANVVGSLKEEDFSFRAAQAVEGDPLGDLAIEINELARALEEERLGALEAASLVRKVMAEAGTVILAFTPEGKVHLLNRAAAALLGGNEDWIRGRTASELGIEDLLEGPASETITRSFGHMDRRWLVRRTGFRQRGVRHRLVVLSEASEALRAEERLAWLRLIRVLGHEINNSLAPIKSITRTLTRISKTAGLPPDIHDNLMHGLEVIGGRADSLNRFLQNYARLAKLPPPKRRICELLPVLQNVASLESRLPVTMKTGPAVAVNMDPDQIEHALINLVKNAVEAVLERGGNRPARDEVLISWQTAGEDLTILVQDQGVGFPQTENLFVPFYTTKQTGSGIGLILSRQIVENHGGQLSMRNRSDIQGCEVIIRIPGCVVRTGAQACVASVDSPGPTGTRR
jgi:two-component system, NtrC family, nitrogen regulation sensor histidine kinase NtrY